MIKATTYSDIYPLCGNAGTNSDSKKKYLVYDIGRARSY